MNKSESKYFHTAKLMDEAILILLEKKDFSYITVKEICDKAGVNRSTFYLHYQNTTELLCEAIETMMEEAYANFSVNQKFEQKITEIQDKTHFYLVSSEYLIPYLEYIEKNKKLFLLFLNKADTLNLQETYNKLFKNIIDPIMLKFGIPENERKYYATYYVNGIIAIITEWINNDCKEDITWIAKIIEKCVMPSAFSYLKNK